MPKARLSMEDGEEIRISGPALGRVLEGRATILGAELGPGEDFRVGRLRSYTIRALKHSTVEVMLEDEARIEKPSPGEEPLEDWVEIADNLISTCDLPCTVTVIGPVEAGKTSFTALLANRALARGISPAIVDSDVGQADIGPPAFVSMALVTQWVLWLRDLEPDASRFIGSIEPAPAAGRIISQVADLVGQALRMGAGLVAIDTDGWVQGWSSLEYKADLIRASRADRIVVLGDPLLYRVYDRIFPGRVVYARSPAKAVARSTQDRRRLRRDNYERFLSGARIRDIDLSRVSVVGSCLLSSVPQNGDLLESLRREVTARIVMVGRYPGGYCVAVESGEPVDQNTLRALQRRLDREVLVVHTGGFKGVLVGLTGPDGNDYPGVVEALDLEGWKLRVRTTYDGEIKAVVFGRVRLGEEYGEAPGRRIWI